jgi:hypothetical protein
MHSGTVSGAVALSILITATTAWCAEQAPPVALATPAPAAAAAPATTNVIGPKIQFEKTVHDFGKAPSGEVVKYTYIFTNTGDRTLELTGVKACGCLTLDYTKKVEPGKTGSVPIGFNSAGYGGPVMKTISVTCNDRVNPGPVLQFKGTIWRPIDVTPQFAVLNLTADAPLTSTTVVITNNLVQPITISPPECNNPAFTAELKTIQPGRDFRVVIAPVSRLPAGNAQAQVIVKTSATNMPAIPITVYANVQATVSINPPQIALQPAPLAQQQTVALSLVDNSTNAMVLSEPTVNAKGVDVRLQEIQPGRQFTATLNFPQGFEIVAGQKVELTLKTTLPMLPTLKVPILQSPRPPSPKPAPIKTSPTIRTNKHRVVPPSELPPIPP